MSSWGQNKLGELTEKALPYICNCRVPLELFVTTTLTEQKMWAKTITMIVYVSSCFSKRRTANIREKFDCACCGAGFLEGVVRNYLTTFMKQYFIVTTGALWSDGSSSAKLMVVSPGLGVKALGSVKVSCTLNINPTKASYRSFMGTKVHLKKRSPQVSRRAPTEKHATVVCLTDAP